MISEYTKLEHDTYRILRKILPGPYTIILESNKALPKRLHDKRKEVGVRVPDSPLLHELIERYQKPLATTSLSEYEAKTSSNNNFLYGYEVERHYGHGIDLILDLGEALNPLQTTILDFTNGGCEVMRQGIGDTSFLS